MDAYQLSKLIFLILDALATNICKIAKYNSIITVTTRASLFK